MRKAIGSNSRQKSRMYITLVMAITAIFTFSAWASAQDAVTPPTIVPAEAPAPEPTVVPAPVVVTEPAPEPDVVTEEVIVPPAEPVVTVMPVEPMIPAPVQDIDPVETEEIPAETGGNVPGAETPTEAIIETQPPAVETAVPTETATETETPATEAPTPSPTVAPATPAPTVTPSPTPEPTPVITWSQPEQVTCELRDGNTPGLKYQESNRYHCLAAVNVASDIAMPADMKIEWKLDVAFPDAHVLEFPAGSLANVKTQLPTSATSTQYTVSQPWQQESGQQNLAFEVEISRNICAIGEQMLTLKAIPSITTEANKAEIRFEGVEPQVKNLISPVIASEQPAVAFDGPITFQSLSATSTGLESNLTTGTATIVVTGEWDPCQEWTLDLTGTVDVSAETPAVLSAVSINQEPISGDACNLTEACDLIVLPATGEAATPLRYTIGMELELHQFTPVGDVGMSLQAGLTAVATQP